jgi:hypothetical protein
LFRAVWLEALVVLSTALTTGTEVTSGAETWAGETGAGTAGMAGILVEARSSEAVAESSDAEEVEEEEEVVAADVAGVDAVILGL